MKYRLLEMLACPACGGSFEVEVEARVKRAATVAPHSRPRCALFCARHKVRLLDAETAEIAATCPTCYQEEITAGRLICSQGHVYPVTAGIPRLLPAEAADPSHGKDGRATSQVKRRFEFQWEKWGQEERLFGQTDAAMADRLVGSYTASTIDEHFYPGRLVLDAGCGHGRYLAGFAELGAEVVGMDFGNGVDLAAAHNQDNPTLHLVQGDVTRPPFRSNTFDLVFSFGVLQFTPAPATAFARLARAVKPGGFFYIWVYPRQGWLWETSQRLIRAVTTRLPASLLYCLCFIPVPLLSIVPTYSGTSLRNSSWRQCAQVVWDWYSPRFQWHHTAAEVSAWYEQADFAPPTFLEVKIGAVGRKKDRAPR